MLAEIPENLPYSVMNGICFAETAPRSAPLNILVHLNPLLIIYIDELSPAFTKPC